MVLKKKVKVFFRKDLEVSKICLTFATAFRFKNGKMVLEKNVENFFQKDLEVWKSCLTFATAFRF